MLNCSLLANYVTRYYSNSALVTVASQRGRGAPLGGRALLVLAAPADGGQHQPLRHPDPRQWKAGEWQGPDWLGALSSSHSKIGYPLILSLQVTVGIIGTAYAIFDKPMTPSEIHHEIYTKVQPYSIIAAVLQQELILYCGKL